MANDFRRGTPLSDQQSVELLDELEMRCPTDVAGQRGLSSWRTKVAVIVRAANVIDREDLATHAQTTELRRLGATCIAARPTMVGSIFHLTFERADLDVAPTLAVCERCSMLSDSSFELRFKFVQEIDLPGHPA